MIVSSFSGFVTGTLHFQLPSAVIACLSHGEKMRVTFSNPKQKVLAPPLTLCQIKITKRVYFDVFIRKEREEEGRFL